MSVRRVQKNTNKKVYETNFFEDEYEKVESGLGNLMQRVKERNLSPALKGTLAAYELAYRISKSVSGKHETNNSLIVGFNGKKDDSNTSNTFLSERTIKKMVNEVLKPENSPSLDGKILEDISNGKYKIFLEKVRNMSIDDIYKILNKN